MRSSLNWAYFYRGAAQTVMVIPGWSILPSYFSAFYPTHNLYVLNPFGWVPDDDTSLSISVQDMSFQSVADVCQKTMVLSMGLSWVWVNAPECLNGPCDIVSPSSYYSARAIRRLCRQLKTSPSVALTAFYRQCLPSTVGWSWWRKTHLATHLSVNSVDILCDWLMRYSNIQVSIPDRSDITLVMDVNDPIGTSVSWGTHTVNKPHSLGHLLTPMGAADLLY
ncbi:MAG: hypothetical protein ACO3K7_02105 [Candidatus Marinamargulisbacteria bacterium]